MSYNGHKNRNHWNVCLWLWNDEKLYRLMHEYVASHATKDQAARHMLYALQTGHHGKVSKYTPDGCPYSISAIRAAMRHVS